MNQSIVRSVRNMQETFDCYLIPFECDEDHETQDSIMAWIEFVDTDKSTGIFDRHWTEVLTCRPEH